jgi:hypothetical protein
MYMLKPVSASVEEVYKLSDWHEQRRLKVSTGEDEVLRKASAMMQPVFKETTLCKPLKLIQR